MNHTYASVQHVGNVIISWLAYPSKLQIMLTLPNAQNRCRSASRNHMAAARSRFHLGSELSQDSSKACGSYCYRVAQLIDTKVVRHNQTAIVLCSWQSTTIRSISTSTRPFSRSGFSLEICLQVFLSRFRNGIRWDPFATCILLMLR